MKKGPKKMKKTHLFLLMILACLLFQTGVFAQTEEMTLIGGIDLDSPVSRMVWDASGEWITIVTGGMYQQFHVEPDMLAQPDGSTIPAQSSRGWDFGAKSYFMSTVSESGVMAALSDDWMKIIVYEEPMDESKAAKVIEPGFKMLSVSVSDDGSMVLADSAEKIRTVVYNTADGEQLYDLDGFSTAAPVYDSVFSPDGSRIIWHSRGTLAVQDAETGAIGETVSLWDFISSYTLAPDNSVLAAGIINDDYENGAVLFFDPQTGEETGRTILGERSPHELSYSADGAGLYAADDHTLYRIDPESFEVTAQLTVTDSEELRISRIAASPDGSSCAVLLSDGSLFAVYSE